jgi:RNA polymerase sigma-70 factor, ECF subfamily
VGKTSDGLPLARFPVFSKERGDELADLDATKQNEPSDNTLVARIARDDSEALGLLFRRYARLVWSIARRILRNNEEADDLLQDVFLFVRRMVSAFDTSKGTVRGLIVHTTYQRAFTRRRYLIRRNFYANQDCEQDALGQAQAPAVPFYDDGLEAHFGRDGLKRAFAELSEEQRETLRLCFFEGFTIAEIAAQLGVSEGNVRHYYYRGLAKLRKYCGPQLRTPKAK